MYWADSLIEFSQYAVNVTFNKLKHDYEKGFQLEDAMRLSFYVAIIGIFLMIIALVVKLMWNCEDEEVDHGGGYARATDTSRLLVAKEEVVYISYGTSDEDLESGEGSCRSSSSSDDLYDEKICAICYDDPRSCQFVPCGHRITCYTCAKRIINDELINTCPICRTIIQKVRKLHILT
ncbi:hypothetical protein ACJIZ3_014924 [Penstemon smallii]|uniref:RING-type domain-containing protein n=1 Tax=Penstemon smallii TaxID=265156 RepID=A0ABD3RSM6_9LAMI